MKIGTIVLVDPALGHVYVPFPSSSLVINLETFALSGGQTISRPRSYDRGEQQIEAQIWQADDATARAMFEDLAAYLLAQHVGLRLPVPVLFREPGTTPYDGDYLISSAKPDFKSGFPGRIPLVLQMRLVPA